MTFKHYLHFHDLPHVGRLEVAEIWGFDASSFKIEQENGRFARDVFFSNEKTKLEITNEYFDKTDLPQTQTNGVVSAYLSHGYNYIEDLLLRFGFEANVEYIISLNEVDYSMGFLDFFTLVKKNNSFEFNIIQNSTRELIKSREDVYINAFSDTDLDGDTIIPCQTVNILQKSKPVQQISEWVSKETQTFSYLALDYFMPYMYLEKYDIDTSLVPFTSRIDDTFTNVLNNFVYIKANSQLSNGKIYIRVKATFKYRPNGNSDTSGDFKLEMSKFVKPFNTGDSHDTVSIYTKSFSGGSNQDFSIDDTIEYDLPYLKNGEAISFYWRDIFTSSGTVGNMEVVFEEFSIKSIYTSTSIDTVQKAVRLIDLIKHNVNSITNSTVTVNAPKYDIGGEHYDNFCLNGYMLGQITDKPFNNKFKDLINVTKELALDYKIKPTEIEIKHFDEFYNENELGAFYELPDSESETKFNDRFGINILEFKYKNYSGSKENAGENTIDDIHGEAQFKMPTKKLDGKLSIEINHIRSAYLIEEARRRALDSKETNSLQDDDKLFIIKCKEVTSPIEKTYSNYLLMRINDSGKLQILNNNSDGDGIYFNWTLLGLEVGGTFEIISGENIGVYTIDTIEIGVLTLTPSTTPTFEGDALITFSYIINVDYINATNEDYSIVNGVFSPDNYSNLDYSIKRNLIEYYSYIATALQYNPSGEIKNTLFKTNGSLETRKTTETESVFDSSSITGISEQAILSPFIYKTKVHCSYSEAKALFENILNNDGFVRCYNLENRIVKGYLKEAEYTWTTEALSLTLELKREDEFINIYKNNDIIYLNQTGYSLKEKVDNFKINNGYVVIYDINEIPLNNPIYLEKVKIDGTSYNDVVDFSEALNDLFV